VRALAARVVWWWRSRAITVYPARHPEDPAAVWHENGHQRQCQSVTEAGLAARIEKVTIRLAADAPGMESPGADLIAYYLSPGRHPAAAPWSRKHADTQRRLRARYLAPVIVHLACEDIETGHMQAAVNAAPIAKEGATVRRCISALVGASITGGYLANPAEAGALASRGLPRTGAGGERGGRVRAVRQPGRDPRA
jgi:hypothetical protein